MSNTGMKVRVFDMAHGLVEYEDVKTIRIISRDYNLLIMKDYLPIIGEIEGNVDIKSEKEEVNLKNIKAFYMFIHKNISFFHKKEAPLRIITPLGTLHFLYH